MFHLSHPPWQSDLNNTGWIRVAVITRCAPQLFVLSRCQFTAMPSTRKTLGPQVYNLSTSIHWLGSGKITYRISWPQRLPSAALPIPFSLIIVTFHVIQYELMRTSLYKSHRDETRYLQARSRNIRNDTEKILSCPDPSWLTQLLRFGRSGASRNLCKSEMSGHMITYTYM